MQSAIVRLPSFAVSDQPARQAVLDAVEARDAAALRALMAHGGIDGPLNAILTSLAFHFEGDETGRANALTGPYPNADWRIVAMTVLAAYAIEDNDLPLGLRRLNVAYGSVSEVHGPNKQALIELIAGQTRAVDHLAKEAGPRLLGARKLRRVGPMSYVVSYPRSGNTMLLNALSHIFQADWYSVFPGDGRYFCRELCDPTDASVLLVKDHVYRGDYFKDRVVYVVRDGRDSMVSLCRFLEVINDWRITDPDGFVDFMVAAAKRYQFGFWGDSVRLATEAKEAGADVTIWRYEDLFANPREYMRIANHLAPDRIVNGDVAELTSRLEQQKSAIDHPQWGYAPDTPTPELFAAWRRNRGGSNWRTVFNGRARQVFHELGGTEMLLSFGYETDPDWWRCDDDVAVGRARPANAWADGHEDGVNQASQR